MEASISRIIKDAEERGIQLDPQIKADTLKKTRGTKKYTKWDLIKMISKWELEHRNNKSKLLEYRNSIESVMLCQRIEALKPEEQKEILKDNNNWYAQRKYNGIRVWLMYNGEEGFKVFSRNRSVTDYLPVDYTDNILFYKNGKFRSCKDFINPNSKTSFILDGECTVETKKIDTSLLRKNGVETNSELNAVVALFAIEPESSKEIQRTQKGAQLIFTFYDIVEYNGTSLVNKAQKDRDVIREKLVDILNDKWDMNFAYPKRVYAGKQAYFDEITQNGGEGIVLKNDTKPYTLTQSRGRDVQVKMKRSMSQMLGSDLDCFITGSVPSTEGKAFENYIGGIKVSIFISEPNGDETEHWLGTIGSIPLELRQKMTIKDPETGEPTLNPEYLGKVLTVEGFDIKNKSLRMSHCRCDWSSCFRPEKSMYECSIDREFLLKNSL